jgi:catechol 2,3-dioxygenase-like lactoylglutathione lyase family enzyme
MHDDLVPPPPLRLAMTMLGVRDVAASVAFYAGTLGLPETGLVASLVFFDAGGTTLVISGEKRAPADPELTIPVEVVLAVASVGDAYAALRDRGVAFVTEPHPIGGPNHVAHFRDPDGHLFSLFGPA